MHRTIVDTDVAELLGERSRPQPNCLVATSVDSTACTEFFLNHVYSL
jgi:purine nucleosidase